MKQLACISSGSLRSVRRKTPSCISIWKTLPFRRNSGRPTFPRIRIFEHRPLRPSSSHRSPLLAGRIIPLLVRRGGCAVNKKSRSHLIPRRRGGRSQTAFQNAFRSLACERPLRPRHQRRLRGILINVASTPPHEEGNSSEPCRAPELVGQLQLLKERKKDSVCLQLFLKRRNIRDRLFAAEILTDICRRFAVDHRAISEQRNFAGRAAGDNRARKILISQYPKESIGISYNCDLFCRADVKINSCKHPAESGCILLQQTSSGSKNLFSLLAIVAPVRHRSHP